MLKKTFPTKIFDKPIVTKNSVNVDLNTNRNAKMINVLLRKDTNGMFLFYLENKGVFTTENVMLPPGLTAEEIMQFKSEFKHLFERYAKVATERIKKNGQR